MKREDINKGDLFKYGLLSLYGERQHYKFAMSLGRVFPQTRAQVKHFISKGYHLGILGLEDVERIEGMLSIVGKSGEYKYTKSKTSVRLINHDDFIEALKAYWKLS